MIFGCIDANYFVIIKEYILMNTCKYQRVNSFMTEVLVVKNPAYWFVLQINWTRFCMIRASIMKDSRHSSSTYKESLFLHVVRHILLFFVLVFFSVFFFSWIFSIHRTVGEGEDLISLYPFYHFWPLCRHLAGLLLQRAHLCA